MKISIEIHHPFSSSPLEHKLQNENWVVQELTSKNPLWCGKKLLGRSDFLLLGFFLVVVILANSGSYYFLQAMFSMISSMWPLLVAEWDCDERWGTKNTPHSSSLQHQSLDEWDLHIISIVYCEILWSSSHHGLTFACCLLEIESDTWKCLSRHKMYWFLPGSCCRHRHRAAATAAQSTLYTFHSQPPSPPWSWSLNWKPSIIIVIINNHEANPFPIKRCHLRDRHRQLQRSFSLPISI